MYIFQQNSIITKAYFQVEIKFYTRVTLCLKKMHPYIEKELGHLTVWTQISGIK